MVLNIDIPATILDLAGVDIPELYQGKSFLPIVHGEAETNGRRDFLCEHLWDIDLIPKWEGVRSERYVYARYFSQNPPYEFLHDLEVDPDQLNNFAKDSTYKYIIDRMRKRTDYYIKNYSHEKYED